jgi:hypothetical protein
LIIVVGENCQSLLGSTVKECRGQRRSANEIWSFVGMKEKQRAVRGKSPEFGDSWTFIEIERETRFIRAVQLDRSHDASLFHPADECSQQVDKASYGYASARRGVV